MQKNNKIAFIEYAERRKQNVSTPPPPPPPSKKNL